MRIVNKINSRRGLARLLKLGVACLIVFVGVYRTLAILSDAHSTMSNITDDDNDEKSPVLPMPTRIRGLLTYQVGNQDWWTRMPEYKHSSEVHMTRLIRDTALALGIPLYEARTAEDLLTALCSQRYSTIIVDPERPLLPVIQNNGCVRSQGARLYVLDAHGTMTKQD